MGQLITIKVRFLEKATGAPVSSDGMNVKLFDQDLINDDFLGESKITSDGSATIEFDLSSIRSGDSPAETKPDLYFAIYKYGKLVYKSQVIESLNLAKTGEFTSKEGQSFNAGTFLI